MAIVFEKQALVNTSRRALFKHMLTGFLAGGILPMSAPLPAHAATDTHRALIVYYSRSGNTRTVAEYIHTFVGGDMLEIQTVHPYPQEYKATTEQAKKELAEGYKPPITTKVTDMSKYTLIFLGSPNWWGTIAPPMMTFLSEYDFTGKTIAAFITHEGSALGQSMKTIQGLCPRAKLVEGLALRGGSVKTSKNDVGAWLDRLGIAHKKS